MSVIAVGETKENQSYRIGEDGVEYATRSFLVEVSTTLDHPFVATATGLPRPWRDYFVSGTSYNFRLLCKNLVINQHPDSPKYFNVTAEYDSKPISNTADGTQPFQNNAVTEPQFRPWVVKFSGNKTTRVLEEAYIWEDILLDIPAPQLVPVVNTVGQPFTDPPVSVPTSNSVMQITAYLPSGGFDYRKPDHFRGTVNHREFTIFGRTFQPDTVQCVEYNAQTSNEGLIQFWTLDIQLEIHEFWNPIRVLNIGTVERKEINNAVKFVQILDDNGTAITKGVPLSAIGERIDIETDDFYYLEFQGYDRTDFSKLINGRLGG